MIQLLHALPPTERFSLVVCGMVLMAGLVSIGWGIREERRRQRLMGQRDTASVKTRDQAGAEAAQAGCPSAV
jgi:hypothetical protein